MKKNSPDVRAIAAKTLARVFQNSLSLNAVLPEALEQVKVKDKGLLQELCYGSLRWFPRLNCYLKVLLNHPLKSKDSDIQALLLMGLYQLQYTRIPDHAALGATVEAAKTLKKNWATKLVNGILRRYLREKDELDQQLADEPAFQTAHPNWLIKTVTDAWASEASNIFAANNDYPPFTLRLNPAFQDRQATLAQLEEMQLPGRATRFSEYGITLNKATDVQNLPLFAEGGLSVQDEAAQLAATLLDLKPGQRVLDACCAPGGKTGHILESEPELEQVVALDSDAKRLIRVEENLARLKFKQQSPPQLLCGDATDPASWWDGQLFDRILIDAPCSGTGVIRRHPDIKLLRKPADIDKLAQLQQQILTSLWALLKPGGVLVYATCSVMPRENTQVVQSFIEENALVENDASCDQLDVDWGNAQPCGQQLLPLSQSGHDGFYYCRLRKQA